MARRSLTAGMISAITEGELRPIILYEGEFVTYGSPSEDVAYLRMWTGVGTLSWDSKSWTGGGNLVSVSPIEETREMQATGFAVSLNGFDSALLSIALQSVRQGRVGTLWLGLLDSSGAVIADPYQLQSGRLDITVIEDNGTEASIVIQYESRLISLEVAKVRYYTTQEIAIDHPGDLGFEFVPSLQDKEVIWG